MTTLMASTLDRQIADDSLARDEHVVVIDAEALEAARRDPRVHAFFAEAESFVQELEREGRNL
jgi:hypothetical protein